MRILGFESWDGGSHRSVRESLVRHGAAQWTWVTLDPGPWRWRQRLGMLELVALARDRGLLDQSWDCFVCTSLLAVGELRGLLPKALRRVPIAMLVHENQVAYPDGVNGCDPRDIHGAVTDLTAMYASDRVVFTSQWNRRSCLDGFKRMLHKSPIAQWRSMLDRIERKSCVIWPPVEDPRLDLGIEHNSNLGGPCASVYAPVHDTQTVAWPHRHQADKGPAALRALAARYSKAWQLQWCLLGERRGRTPVGLERFRLEQAESIIHDEFCEDRQDYVRQLAEASWVCSTAKHEFFGIAVVEALLLGCLPWLPNRLSYPELLPEEARGLHPGMTIGDAQRQSLRSSIAMHLKPAIAPEATARLEVNLRQLVDSAQ